MPDVNDFNANVIDEFRSNEGRVGGPFEGAPMVLLTTTGAKTGIQRTTPLACLEGEDGEIYVFATKAGAPENPAWYHNLVANPSVVVERGIERYEATAVPLEGAERDVIYASQAKLRPAFAEYAEKTTRAIPVIELQRA